jgi:hypothetical protein
MCFSMSKIVEYYCGCSTSSDALKRAPSAFFIIFLLILDKGGGWYCRNFMGRSGTPYPCRILNIPGANNLSFSLGQLEPPGGAAYKSETELFLFVAGEFGDFFG